MLIHRCTRLVFWSGMLLALLGAAVHADSTRPGDPVAVHMARLERYVTEWRALEHHFNLKGEEIATVKSTEEITWMLNRRAIRRTYVTIKGDIVAYKAIGTLTWNEQARGYDGVWFDTASETGPTTVKAEWDNKERTMIYTLDSVSKEGKAVRHKVIERFPDDEHRTATTFRVNEDGGVVKILEVEYKRTTPCPSRQMRVIDELLD